MRSLSAAALCALIAAPAFADPASEAAAADLLHRRMENENPADAALLRSVHGRLVVVVRGSMDHIEEVLRAARIEHTVIDPHQVAGYALKSNMVLMVNCPGVMPDEGVRRIERFVRAGGLLYTTDWSLKNVVEKAFPNTIRHNGRGTADELVPVTVDEHADNLMSRMLLRKAARPQWWLEGSSYPIEILNPKRVQVLAHSDAMEQRYGAGPVVVKFRWEDGEVIHVVSHFYRQVNARGPQVAAAKAVGSYEGLSAKDKKELAQAPAMAGNAADVESSYAFQRMTANLVTGKQKANRDLDKRYDTTVNGPVSLRSTASLAAPPVAAATAGVKLRILEKRDGQLRVRDDEGNEGWVEERAAVKR